MLYRTHNPFLFPFTYPPPPPPPSSAVSSATALLQRMEMEGILGNSGLNDAAGEDFFVDDLLVDGEDGFFEAEAHDKPVVIEAVDKNPTPLVTSPVPKKVEVKDNCVPVVDDFGSVPAEDVADLEWLSQFVEDSNTGYSLTCQPSKPGPNLSEPGPVQSKPSAQTPVQTKARSKRARTGGRVWSLGGSPDSSSSTSSSTSSDTCLILHSSCQTAESLTGPKPVQPKNQKKRTRLPIAGSVGPGRRCSHCGVQKTPQWRTGPNGAKTLCNACGVRFKSGRLFPEYRPACSPTFSSDLHSNNHRKVLEMRRKKQGDDDVALGPHPVRSF